MISKKRIQRETKDDGQRMKHVGRSVGVRQFQEINTTTAIPLLRSFAQQHKKQTNRKPVLLTVISSCEGTLGRGVM
jgi:hypothetical protein